jgi:hypothetical protein
MFCVELLMIIYWTTQEQNKIMSDIGIWTKIEKNISLWIVLVLDVRLNNHLNSVIYIWQWLVIVGV